MRDKNTYSVVMQLFMNRIYVANTNTHLRSVSFDLPKTGQLINKIFTAEVVLIVQDVLIIVNSKRVGSVIRKIEVPRNVRNSKGP